MSNRSTGPLNKENMHQCKPICASLMFISNEIYYNTTDSFQNKILRPFKNVLDAFLKPCTRAF